MPYFKYLLALITLIIIIINVYLQFNKQKVFFDMHEVFNITLNYSFPVTRIEKENLSYKITFIPDELDQNEIHYVIEYHCIESTKLKVGDYISNMDLIGIKAKDCNCIWEFDSLKDNKIIKHNGCYGVRITYIPKG